MVIDPVQIKHISSGDPHQPHLGVTLHVLFEVCCRLELLFAGLAGVDSDARQLFAMLLQVEGELALQDKLISALWTDQILQSQERTNRGCCAFGPTSTTGLFIAALTGYRPPPSRAA